MKRNSLASFRWAKYLCMIFFCVNVIRFLSLLETGYVRAVIQDSPPIPYVPTPPRCHSQISFPFEFTAADMPPLSCCLLLVGVDAGFEDPT